MRVRKPITPNQRAKAIDAIADKADAERHLSDPTLEQLDKWWPKSEVLGKPRVRPVPEKDKRRYRGSRSNEDKAAAVRRAVYAVLDAEHPKLSDVKLAQWVHKRMVIDIPDVPKPAVRTLRRIIAKVLKDRKTSL